MLVSDIDLTKRKFVDVQVIYHKLEQRTLSAAYKFYCGKNLEDAHTAEADTRATYEVLKAQLDHYPDVLQNDINYCRNIPATARTWTLPEESCMTITAWKCSTSENTKVFRCRKYSRRHGLLRLDYERRLHAEHEECIDKNPLRETGLVK